MTHNINTVPEEHGGPVISQILGDTVVPVPSNAATVTASTPARDSIEAAPSRKPRVEYRLLWHQGSKDHDYQDAAAFSPDTGSAAIADGATASVCQKEWADILVRLFAATPTALDSDDARSAWWRSCTDGWLSIVEPRIPVWKSDLNRYWTSLRKFQAAGADATFLALHLHENEMVRTTGYTLYAVGDCCAFWFQGSPEIGTLTFIRQQPEITVFDNTPDLLTSRLPFPTQKLKVYRSDETPGNFLVLATDALAEYLAHERPWEDNSAFWSDWWQHSSLDSKTENVSAFGDWTEKLHASGKLKADDYTLLMVRIMSTS